MNFENIHFRECFSVNFNGGIIVNKKVSFLIAAYNEEKYIQECLYSCLKQTYNNIEVCIVDDGSHDKTWEIIEKNSTNDTRVKKHRFQTNKGKVIAFNKAFEMSSGEYVAIIGADDKNVQERIEISLKKVEYYDLICFNLIAFSDDQIEQASLMESKFGIKSDCDLTFEMLLFRPIVYGGTIFAKRHIAERIFPLPLVLTHEDWWIPLKAAAMGSVKYFNIPIIYYRQHPDQSSKRIISYNDWLEKNSREIGYYSEILKEFQLTIIQKNYVLMQCNQQLIYLEKSIILRLRLFIEFSYAYCLLKKQIVIKDLFSVKIIGKLFVAALSLRFSFLIWFFKKKFHITSRRK